MKIEDKCHEPIIIDRLLDYKDGQTWYHLGNMYWSPEYKEFYKWFNTLNPKCVENETDFPHDYFRFRTDVHEEEFLHRWGHRVKEVMG